MNNVTVYRGGVPTAPDVKKLLESFTEQELSQGTIIEYSKISNIIGVDEDSSRFKTVVNAWRKYLEQTMNILLGTLRGRGFMVLSDSGKLDAASDKYKSATKLAARAVSISTTIEVKNLTADERVSLTKLQTKAGLFALHEATKRKQILPDM